MSYQISDDRLISKFLIFSILVHLIIYALTVYVYPTKKYQTQPNHYVPAYTYKPYKSVQTSPAATAAAMTKKSDFQPQPKDVVGLKPRKNKEKQIGKSILASSLEVLHNDLLSSVTKRNDDPIYLIGDSDQPADGIILVLAKALSAHFTYPRVAGELGIRGRVLIAVTLHPDGHFSDVQMLQSSNSDYLDNAALYAVNSAPLADGADRFLQAPKRFVIGYIFR